MTVYDDNPAGRLHRLLGDLRTRQDSEPIQAAWATLLRVPGDDSAELARCTSQVLQLPAEIEAEVDKIEEGLYDRDLVMRWKEPVKSTLAATLFTTGQIRQFGDGDMTSLEACNDMLHRLRPQRMLTDSELERITALISELEEELKLDHNIDPELRDFLLIHVQTMARALRDLPIRGPVALEEALDQAVGAGFRRTDLTVRSDTSPSAWHKFGNLIVVIAAALQIAGSSLTLPDQLRQALEAPPPAPAPVIKIIQEMPTEPGVHPPAAPTGDHSR